MRPATKKDEPVAIYCAEPVPDVALGSEISGNGSIGTKNALTTSAIVTSSLTRENASLINENDRLRRELGEAVRDYERKTGREYKEKFDAERSSNRTFNSDDSLNLIAAGKLAVTVSELGGRSQQVLLAREFLYRLCEARANNFIQSEKAFVALQTSALSMIESIYQAQRSSIVAAEATAYAEVVKQVSAYNTQRKSTCTDVRNLCNQGIPLKDGKPDLASSEAKNCILEEKKCLEEQLIKAPPQQQGSKTEEKPLVKQVMEASGL